MGGEVPVARQHRLQEGDHLGLLRLAEVVGLVQNEEQPDGVSPYFGKTCKLRLRHGRIRREHEQGRIAFGQYPQGRIRIMQQCRSDARRVDHHHPVAQDFRGKKQIDTRDAAPVFRIPLFSDPLPQGFLRLGRRGRMNFIGRPVAEIRDADQRHRPPCDEGRDRGCRHNCRGQQQTAQQRVDEGALAALELSQHRDLQAAHPEPFIQTRESVERGAAPRPCLAQTPADFLQARAQAISADNVLDGAEHVRPRMWPARRSLPARSMAPRSQPSARGISCRAHAIRTSWNCCSTSR